MRRIFMFSAFLYSFSCPGYGRRGHVAVQRLSQRQSRKATYGFEPSQEWLDHVRLSSVRFNNGGSGSFVSADGLTFTNHHVGAECIQQLSTGGTDYMKTGFYAKTRRPKRPSAPTSNSIVLVGIEDVSTKVKAR